MNKIDKTKEYPYEYWFQFENLEGNSNFELNKKSGEHVSSIILINYIGDSIPFAEVQVKNLDSDTNFTLDTDINGKANIKLEEGNYSLTISVLQYKKQVFEFEILNSQFMELIINLGHPVGSVYQLDSKSELNEERLFDIMNCVRSNPKDYHNTCVKIGEYSIMNHL